MSGAESLISSEEEAVGSWSATAADTHREDGEALLKTGIGGLDEILGGGFPAERLYLVEGEPGSGKTTLSLQFLLEGLARGERGLYVTLSETAQELAGVAASHGWSLDGIEMLDMSATPAVTSVESQYTVFHPSEVELQDSVGAVLERVQAVGPSRVVLDSLSEMRLLARDPLRFRRQILSFKQFFASRGITALMLDDLSASDRDLQLHSLAHGVINLEQIVLSHGAERRQLRVTKLRGVRFHAGHHDFVIRSGGLEVFPRIRLGVEVPPSEHRLSFSGSREVDALLGGGLIRGSSVLMAGAPGTGKSVLCTAASAEAGQRVAMYLFDERMGTFAERAAGLGMDVERHIASGAIRVTALEPTEISPGEFVARVRGELTERKVSMVVIDSLNGFTKAMSEERQLTLKIHELLSYLGTRGVTTLLTLAQRGIFGAQPDEATDVSYLADAVVLLRYFEAHGEVRRAISVMKQRSGAHESTIREFRIDRGGLLLGDPLTDFQGVLTGVPTFTGNQTSLMAGD